ncbi:hypothetical protein GTR02_13675 [Kineococcus sp. R8]|uniref:hypothetical protein n=1 Tax=Kineococcus siccus TaxID=2696567 RepID=UPI001412D584|nr:hypothetical protein [Kineococcus siccus]NAZ82867.1 hypothetical protein [Kineococcus siccus]
MDANEARDALTLVARRRQQTVTAGSAAWSARATWSTCASVLALGVLTDVGMIWLWVLLMVMGVGVAWNNGVRLRSTAASRRWRVALVGSFVVAYLAYVAGQFPARALDWPLPNTVGAAAACLVIVTLVRAVHARLAGSLRP